MRCDLANASVSDDRRVVREVDRNLRIAGCCSQQLRGYVEDRVASAFTSKADDDLAGLDDFAGARPCFGDDARRVCPEFGEAHQVVGCLQLGLGGIDLGLRRLTGLFGLVEIHPGGPALRQQRFLSFEVIASLGQLALRSREGRLRLSQRVQLILRLQARQHLARLNGIAEAGVVFDDAARDAGSKRSLVLGLEGRQG